MTEYSIEQTQNGLQTVRIGNQYLHSRYDPMAEAEKFISDLSLDQTVCCILLCPALGYLVTVIHKKHPFMKILSVNPDQWYVENKISHGNNYTFDWSPENSKPLFNFLLESLNDCDATMTEVIIWAPATKIHPEFCNRTTNEIQNFLKTAHSNWLTLAYFGKKWFNNTLRNYLQFGSETAQTKPDLPVFLAASGPGLAMALPLIHKYRDRFSLWALPSSIRALAAFNIQPDVIVTSDAGYWAGRHLSYIPNEWFESNETSVYCPFRANIQTLQKRIGSVVFHSSGNLLDSLIQSAVDDNFNLCVPDRGTIAATAIELLIIHGVKELFIAGLDFANQDIQSHIKPNSFAEQPFISANRCTPAYFKFFLGINESIFHDQKEYWNTTQTLEIYRSWFEKRNFQNDIIIWDFNPSGLKKGFSSIKLPELENLLKDLPSVSKMTTVQSNRKSFTNHGSVTLKTATKIIETLNTMLNNPQNFNLPIFQDFLNQIAPFTYRNWRRATLHGIEQEKGLMYSKLLNECQLYLSKQSVFLNNYSGNC